MKAEAARHNEINTSSILCSLKPMCVQQFRNLPSEKASDSMESHLVPEMSQKMLLL